MQGSAVRLGASPTVKPLRDPVQLPEGLAMRGLEGVVDACADVEEGVEHGR
jgi:hypothetical protein